MFGNAGIYDNAKVDGNAKVFGNTILHDNSHVSGNAVVLSKARMYGNASVSGNVQIRGSVCLYANAYVSGHTFLSSCADIGNITDYITVSGMYKESFETFFRCRDREIRGIGKYSSIYDPLTLTEIRKNAMLEGDLEYAMLCELVEKRFLQNR